MPRVIMGHSSQTRTGCRFFIASPVATGTRSTPAGDWGFGTMAPTAFIDTGSAMVLTRFAGPRRGQTRPPGPSPGPESRFRAARRGRPGRGAAGGRLGAAGDPRLIAQLLPGDARAAGKGVARRHRHEQRVVQERDQFDVAG